jgi:hypothetical protein
MFSVYGQAGLKCVRDGEGNFPFLPLIKPTPMHYLHQHPRLIQALPTYVKELYVVNNFSQKGTEHYVRYHFSSLINKEKLWHNSTISFWALWKRDNQKIDLRERHALKISYTTRLNQSSDAEKSFYKRDFGGRMICVTTQCVHKVPSGF